MTSPTLKVPVSHPESALAQGTMTPLSVLPIVRQPITAVSFRLSLAETSVLETQGVKTIMMPKLSCTFRAIAATWNWARLQFSTYEAKSN
jgi:hypothetical protein